MIWITLAIAGYFFAALANIADKYILSAKIPTPSVYAFFVAVFSLFAVLFTPFGLRILSADMMAIALCSGALFAYGLVFFYKAVRESEISRVAPLMGALMAIGALMYSLVMRYGASNGAVIAIQPETVLAFWLLVSGSLLVVFDLPLRMKDAVSGIRNTLIASIFSVISLIMLKHVYDAENFVSGFVWSRMGLFLGGVSLLAVPTFRQEIIASLHEMSQSKPAHSSVRRKQASIGAWFVSNKVIAALGSMFIQYALFLGPLVAVQALSGLQFAFVFLMAMALSYRFPALYREKLHFNDWVQKIIALTLIGLGVYFSVQSGAQLFM